MLTDQLASYIFLVVICTCCSDKKILSCERPDIFADRDSGRGERKINIAKPNNYKNQHYKNLLISVNLVAIIVSVYV